MTENLTTTLPRTLTAQQVDGIVTHLLYAEEACALIRGALEVEEPERNALNGAMNVLSELILIAETFRKELSGANKLTSYLKAL